LMDKASIAISAAAAAARAAALRGGDRDEA
jgi:hypothetical protein